MGSTSLAYVTATVLCALALGGMVFFAAVFAPAVVRKLSSEVATGVINAVFPFYYSCLIVLSGVAAGLLWSRSEATVLAAMAVLFAFARFALVPRMDRARQASSAGDTSETETFAHLQSLSALVHFAQMAALVAVFVRLLVA
jgi:hypothetical protein